MLTKFAKLFGQKPIVIQAPGRINLIGEHTDYNQGFVLPAAIDKYVRVGIIQRQDQKIALYSEQYDEYFEISIGDIKPLKNHWANYISGIVVQLIGGGHSIAGFNMMIDGDIPIGAGISSSAALECATTLALSELFHLKLSRLGMSMIAQAAEHEFAGVRCGIMDQFASAFGKKNRAIKLDCQSFKYEYIPLDLDEYQIVLFDTNVKHSLAASEYNNRRQECEEGVRLIKRFHPHVKSLRQVTLPMLHQYVDDPLILRRCEYVIKENDRLLTGCEELKKGDIDAFGLKMYQSHIGLKEEYEVSCEELDFLINSVRFNQAVLGARMMGGGFGGCTINIIVKEAVDEIIREVGNNYSKNFDKEINSYMVNIVDGAAIVETDRAETKMDLQV